MKAVSQSCVFANLGWGLWGLGFRSWRGSRSAVCGCRGLSLAARCTRRSHPWLPLLCWEARWVHLFPHLHSLDAHRQLKRVPTSYTFCPGINTHKCPAGGDPTAGPTYRASDSRSTVRYVLMARSRNWHPSGYFRPHTSSMGTMEVKQMTICSAGAARGGRAELNGVQPPPSTCHTTRWTIWPP